MPELSNAMTVAAVTVTLDGRPLTAATGTTVLAAALAHGIDISYFCWHPDLSVAAVCRQCLVEIVGQPKLAPACQTVVVDGMAVLTDSARVLAARRQMLEFTLLNHPVDCPICDKAGECLLQKLYLEWNAKAARIDYPKIHKPKVVDLGPHVVLDAERCILCTRCIRVCDEVARVHELDLAHRGDHTTLGVPPGHRLENPYSLCTVDVCPVGALTSKDFRFAMRAWELSATASVCAGCATGCSIEVHHARGRIYRLIPRPNAAVNRSWMCDTGRMTYKEVHTARLTTPLVRGALRPWDQALATASDALRAAHADPDRAAVTISTQISNEDAFAAVRLAAALGIARLLVSGRPPGFADGILIDADKNPNSAGVRALVGPNGRSMETLIQDLGDGAVRTLLSFGDPCLAQATLEEASGLTLLLLDTHQRPATPRAAAAFPATLWAEHDATYVNRHGFCQRARAAVRPPAPAVPMWRTVVELARRLGLPLAWDAPAEVFAALRAEVPAMAHAEFGAAMPSIQLRFNGSRG
jgi:NADH-quinone oxidoreductase subunit G